MAFIYMFVWIKNKSLQTLPVEAVKKNTKTDNVFKNNNNAWDLWGYIYEITFPHEEYKK